MKKMMHFSEQEKQKFAENRKNTHCKHSRLCLTLKQGSGMLKGLFPISPS
jgi:hypothetical protein